MDCLVQKALREPERNILDKRPIKAFFNRRQWDDVVNIQEIKTTMCRSSVEVSMSLGSYRGAVNVTRVV